MILLVGWPRNIAFDARYHYGSRKKKELLAMKSSKQIAQMCRSHSVVIHNLYYSDVVVRDLATVAW
jgi:hypothetical protein